MLYDVTLTVYAAPRDHRGGAAAVLAEDREVLADVHLRGRREGVDADGVCVVLKRELR